MNKSKLSTIVLPSVFLIAFNAVFFIVGGIEHPVSVWLAYGVIHFSYLMSVLTPLFVKNGKYAMETGTPLAMVSSLHFAAEFIVGLIVFLVSPNGYKGLLVLYIILLAVYLIAFFSILWTVGHTEQAAQRQAGEVAYIQRNASRVKLLLNKLPDAALNKQIEKVYDDLHASPSRSNGAVRGIEVDIVMKIGELEAAVHTGQKNDASKISTDILYLIEERNRLL